MKKGRPANRLSLLRTRQGFTLIEVIVSLVLVGIMSASVGLGFVYVVQAFVFTKVNTATLQKAQMAMSRISMELGNISLVSSPSTDRTITFDSYKYDVKKTRSIHWNDDRIEINDGAGVFHILTNQVATTDGFKLQYYANYNDTDECYPPSAKV
ncbi:MAG: type II secretion system protein, partial [Smithellaceae bacterium]|nr:type II secretion system protein [Smithellaceae bacterium]